MGMDFQDLSLYGGSAPNLLGHIQSSLPRFPCLSNLRGQGRSLLTWFVPWLVQYQLRAGWMLCSMSNNNNLYITPLTRGSCVTSEP